MRASAGIMFLFGLYASVNGFVLHRYEIIPYVMGELVINILIGLLINLKFSHTVLLEWIFVRKQTPILIGEVQKKFTWSNDLLLPSGIFVFFLFFVK